jgi:hypothetical protein
VNVTTSEDERVTYRCVQCDHLVQIERGEDEMRTLQLAEWREEGKRRGNGSLLDAPFVCPACGNVATARQFKDLGENPNDASQECIGRAKLKHGTPKDQVGEWGKKRPCNWAAYGLMGTLGKGVTIITPEGPINAFEFAPEPMPIGPSANGAAVEVGP